MKTILVIGATGSVGREVVRLLANEKNVVVRAGTRQSDRLTKTNHVSYIPFDYSNLESMATAMQDVQSVFLVTPTFHPEEEILGKRAVDVAKENNVEHIVRLSVIGTDNTPDSPHGIVEQHIENSGMDYTHLRPNFFMQNFNVSYATTIREEGVFYSAGADGKASWVDTRDVAAVAAQALLEDKHRGQAYTLTGQTSFSNQEVADLMTEVLGRRIAYIDVGDEDMRQTMLQMGMPAASVEKFIGLFPVLRAGYVSFVDPTLEQLLQRKATSMKQYIADYASYFTIG